MKSFHFDLGDSGNGPIGFCARVIADSKPEAVRQLKLAVKRFINGMDISHLSTGGEGIEYIEVYFNPDKITTKDIDSQEQA